MKKIKRENLSEQVFEQLKDEIIQGNWDPGSKIPSENELTKMLGVSRITVRGALQKLVSLGLLETRQGKGTYVRKYSPELHMNALIPFFLLDRPDTMHVLEYRKIVEIGTVGLVVERATKKDIKKLEGILARMQKYKDNTEKFSAEDFNFHLALAQITRNPVITKINYIIKDILSSAMVDIVNSLGTKDGLYYHRKIIEAIKERDENRARSLMEKHVVRTIERISEFR